MKAPFKSAFLIIVGLITIIIGVFKTGQDSKCPDGVGACVWHAAEEANKHNHADILLVKYKDLQIGHAYCIFEKDGNKFGWDWRGAQQVLTCESALELAQELEPPIPNLVPVSAQLIHVK